MDSFEVCLAIQPHCQCWWRAPRYALVHASLPLAKCRVILGPEDKLQSTLNSWEGSNTAEKTTMCRRAAVVGQWHLSSR